MIVIPALFLLFPIDSRTRSIKISVLLGILAKILRVRRLNVRPPANSGKHNEIGRRRALLIDGRRARQFGARIASRFCYNYRHIRSRARASRVQFACGSSETTPCVYRSSNFTSKRSGALIGRYIVIRYIRKVIF